MNTTSPASLALRTRASILVNEYARKQAALIAATAEINAELTALTARLNAAAAPHKAELDRIKGEAEALALEHSVAIFDGMRTLTENGFTLAIRETAAVQVDDEDSAIRALKRDAEDSAKVLNNPEAAMACNACLRINVELDREYISRHYDEHPGWFQQYGISVVDKLSASLKPAPKPRAKKATAKLKTADKPVEQEAA